MAAACRIRPRNRRYRSLEASTRARDSPKEFFARLILSRLKTG